VEDNGLRLSICAISDPKKLSEIQEELDAFIIKNSRNPFMLTAFIKEMMESTLQKGSIPIVLVLKADEKIIGAAPLLLTKKFGMRFTKLLFDFWFSPDFIFDEVYREVCMQNSLTFIFGHLKSKFATFDLPAESLSLHLLEQACETNRIYISKKNDADLNHRIIPVDRTWTDFQKSRGKYFRQEFRGIERKLGRAGKWQILLFENNDHEQDAFQKIIDVEKTSWKQNWRLQQHVSEDVQLFQLWNGSSSAIKTCPGFKRSVWFLELNGHPIAYSLVILYKGTAYVTKTSYDNQYREIYPGIYAINESVRYLFNSGGVKTIDFMTNLPFVQKWASMHQLRVRFLLSKGFLPNLLTLLIQQPQTRIMWRLIQS
jgi:hypothetical protein